MMCRVHISAQEDVLSGVGVVGILERNVPSHKVGFGEIFEDAKRVLETLLDEFAHIVLGQFSRGLRRWLGAFFEARKVAHIAASEVGELFGEGALLVGGPESEVLRGHSLDTIERVLGGALPMGDKVVFELLRKAVLPAGCS